MTLTHKQPAITPLMLKSKGAGVLKGLYACKQILFRVKFNVPIVGRGVQIIAELHEIAVDFAVMCADNSALMRMRSRKQL